jgi:hypothetical protein
MLTTIVSFGGLNVEELRAKPTSIGCNGSNVFQNVRVGVTTQMKENVASFFMEALFIEQLGYIGFYKN